MPQRNDTYGERFIGVTPEQLKTYKGQIRRNLRELNGKASKVWLIPAAFNSMNL